MSKYLFFFIVVLVCGCAQIHASKEDILSKYNYYCEHGGMPHE